MHLNLCVLSKLDPCIEISALEEIAYRNNWISKEQLLESAKLYGKSPYGKHLRRVVEGQIQG